MNRKTNRRAFLRRSALAGAGALVVGSSVLAKNQSPNEKLNIGVVGVAGRGGGNMGAVAGENIVALCDVDERKLAGAAQGPTDRKARLTSRVFPCAPAAAPRKF